MRGAIALSLLISLLPRPGMALEVAKYVVAEEITGVVVDADTAKPLPGTVVAIRFWRSNTGHSGEHCFRSMAVETDAEGRFKFPPWKQENTRANATLGSVTSYREGYSEPKEQIYVRQESRPSLLGLAFSDTIKIPKTELRIEVSPFKGTDEERLQQVAGIASRYSCRWQAESEDMVLLLKVREEIASSSLKDIRPRGWTGTALRWIEDVIAMKRLNK